jgi:serine/threonine protein phosphatase PrpC
MDISSYGATLVGSSGINGDSFYISPDNKVYVLSDGASGAGKNGKVLMSSTCIEIAKQYDFTDSHLSSKEYVDSLFWKMNNRLIEISQENRIRLYGTIIIAVIDDGVLTATTFGDSPVFFFTNGTINRVARNKKRYEDMIEDGYITKDEYEGYVKQMHERMRSCFDCFFPEVVPNNLIEQYKVNQGDMIFLCCDGLSDWIKPDDIFTRIADYGVKAGVEELILQAKEESLSHSHYYDDITAIAISFQ